MRAVEHFIRTRVSRTVMLVLFCLVARLAWADTVNAVWNSVANVPVTANGYTATGNTIAFALNCAPATGTDLMVVNNTNLTFIVGAFDNLPQGQAVALTYDGVTYRFVANYFGGSGNDLVLVWASNRPCAWGRNSEGQLGDNSTTQRQRPAPVTAAGVLAGRTVVALSAGYWHSLALCADGTVAAWGANDMGQLGDNSTNSSVVPVQVNAASGVSALYGKTVVAVAAGGYHSLALCSDGTVAAWGGNSDGQLGDNTLTRRTVPVAVNTASGVSALYGKTVVAVAAGGNHSLALCSDGLVAAWGLNLSGQLGDNTTTSRLVPVSVNTAAGESALFGKVVAAIAAGAYHSLALCDDGMVAAWGDNLNGQLGIKGISYRCTAPTAVNTNSGVSALYGQAVVAIAAGGAHSLALCASGALAAWGYNFGGQVGDNTTMDRDVPVVVNTASDVSALYGKAVVAIAAASFHSLACCSDGTVATWGYNSNGQLGDNTTTQRTVPTAVDTAPLTAGQRIVCAFSGPVALHTLALVAGPPASEITLTLPQTAADGTFQFTFTNTPGAFFGVLAATNPALPLSNWTTLGDPTEGPPGQFQFTDLQASDTPRRFYRVRSP
jgi:alpha-tubulin suppressor-like RCC1 family protein